MTPCVIWLTDRTRLGCVRSFHRDYPRKKLTTDPDDVLIFASESHAREFWGKNCGPYWKFQPTFEAAPCRDEGKSSGARSERTTGAGLLG